MPVTTVATVEEAQALLAAAPSPVVVIAVHDSYDDVGAVPRRHHRPHAGRHRGPRRRRRRHRPADRRRARTSARGPSAMTSSCSGTTTNLGFVRSCNDAFAATAGRGTWCWSTATSWSGRSGWSGSPPPPTAPTPWPRPRALTNHGTILSVPDRNRPRRAHCPTGLTPAGGRPAGGRRQPAPAAVDPDRDRPLLSTSAATPSTSSAASTRPSARLRRGGRLQPAGRRPRVPPRVRRRRVHVPPGRRAASAPGPRWPRRQARHESIVRRALPVVRAVGRARARSTPRPPWPTPSARPAGRCAGSPSASTPCASGPTAWAPSRSR